MRVFLIGVALALGFVYSWGAVYFWRHERSAQSLAAARELSLDEVAHPEAALGLVRDGMEQNDFSGRIGALIELAAAELPAFYQPPALEAAFYATRLERPDVTREAFERAIARFPENGRLHLDYASWLLAAPSILPGLSDTGDDAAEHVRAALRAEPELTAGALATLERYRVPPERWAELVPEEPEAQRRLIAALARAGFVPEALEHMRWLLENTEEVRYQRQVAHWALTWDDPELALEATELWRANPSAAYEAHEPMLVATRAQLALGQFDEAYETFRASLEEVGPSTSSGLKLLCGVGEEYLRLDRLALAESLFFEAQSYSPTYVRALLGLARVHLRRGSDELAARYFEQILTIDPGHEAAGRELMKIVSRQARD